MFDGLSTSSRHISSTTVFYLTINSIINEMTEIYVEEKQADHRSAIHYQLIKHRLIEKQLTTVEGIHKRARCINQHDLAYCQAQLAYHHFALGEEEIAEGYIAASVASSCLFNDANPLKHAHLQEILFDRSMTRYQYDRAYEFIQMAIQCHRQQRWVNVPMRQNDILMRQNNDRKREKWQLQDERLKKKVIDLEMLFTPESDDKEAYFHELALSEYQPTHRDSDEPRIA